MHRTQEQEALNTCFLSELLKTRTLSQTLASTLSDADATVQSMDDASPAKWHLAHTTWFFETFLLKPHDKDYTSYDERFPFLYNSYYEALGARHPRPMRGMITRPSLSDVLGYRTHVNDALEQFLSTSQSDEVNEIVTLGIHHEQQHQELLLTDILHLFAQNPLKPAYQAPEPLSCDNTPLPPLTWTEFEGGTHAFGYNGSGFSFDCEGPRHERIIEPFKIANRCVTNEEWITFIGEGGYATPTLWLSDGWATVNREDWNAPLYWEKRDGTYWSMTLRGLQPVDPKAPVTHISYFEADAYASFVGKRLPTEFEWELAAAATEEEGANMLVTGRLRPAPVALTQKAPAQLFGDVWEWTQSPFSAYPRYSPLEGAVGEYNGKFMNGQYVLRGGSCLTPAKHIRSTYRNFFQPDKRWQMSGLRLADNK